VSYERTGQYLRSVEKLLGVEQTRQFFRYFVPPSLGHGMTGPGADEYPSFAALEDWVERGRPPDGLIGTKRDLAIGAPRSTRPLCEYGSYPRYRGNGDPNDAGSFVCTTH
jgi:feruloyl esterase